MTKDSTGSRIKELRKTMGITQKGLGLKIKVSDATVNRYESNIVRPSIDALIAMSKLFDVSVDYLLCLTDNYH